MQNTFTVNEYELQLLVFAQYFSESAHFAAPKLNSTDHSQRK